MLQGKDWEFSQNAFIKTHSSLSWYFQNCYPMTPLGQDAASPSEAAPLCLLKGRWVLYVTDSASIFFQGLWACQSLGRATWSCRPHPGVSVSHWIVQGQTRQLSALSSAWELSVANWRILHSCTMLLEIAQLWGNVYVRKHNLLADLPMYQSKW